MQIFPAIDIRNGKCVRLKQGDYVQETIYAEDPIEMANHWAERGAKFLHIVDLDGAKDGAPTNKRIICEMANSLCIPIEVGGGVRTEDTIQEYIDAGVARIIIGTLALKNPHWFEQMTGKFPNMLVLGIDAKNGFVATEGWLETSLTSAIELASRFSGLPLAALVYTDIAKDGMLEGPNFTEMKAMQDAVPVDVIASGGVTKIEDVIKLRELGLAGCIIGKALYEKTLTLEEALLYCHRQ